MSQEYTEDKDVTLKKLSSSRRILEAVLVVVALFAVYLMAALLSFNPSDPSWSQTSWHGPIHNLGGGVGAWMADTLLFIFGVLAYAIPPIMICLCWAGFRQRDNHEYIDYFSLSLRLIGTLALIVTSCGLASLNIDDLYYFASGGVIGSLLGTAMMPWFNNVGGTLVLLCVWSAGLTLFTGWSWLTIAEKIGGVVLGVTTFMTNRSRRDDGDYDYDDRYDDHGHQEDDDRQDHQDAQRVEKAPVPVAAAPLAAAPLPEADDDDDDVLFSAPSLRELVSTAAVQPLQPAAATVDPIEVTPTPVIAAAPVAPPVVPVEATPAVPETPPLYSFELPEETPAPRSIQPTVAPLTHRDDQPQWGDWNRAAEPAPSRSPFDFNTTPDVDNVAATLTATTTAAAVTPGLAHAAQSTVGDSTFMPAFSAVSEDKPQVKKGFGPELPRPNPVKLPTRRELASYGIKLPSQRMAELQEKQALQAQSQQAQAALSQQEQDTAAADEAALQEAALREAWVAQQNQRYGEETAEQVEVEDDEDALLQAQLRQQFAAREEARYQPAEQPAHEIQQTAVEPAFSHEPITRQNISTHDAFNFSPLADLVDDTPVEPLFTLPQQTEASPQPAAYSQSAAPATVVPQPAPEPAKPAMDSLIHPFLMRNEQPMSKPTTPLPSLDLLTSAPAEEEPVDMFALEQTAQLIEARLNDYRIKAVVVDKLPGPVITRFELDLAPGVKAARISNLSRDLARSLSTVAVRIVEVIPGKPYVGLELPNKKRQTVYLREVLDCAKFKNDPSPLTVVLGKDIAGEPVVADLAKMPHLLVAGTTGSGKSVGVNAMILSMLYKATPEDVRFIMIDPKMLELSVYEGIPHLLTEVVTDMKDAANALRWCVGEMERRYKLMSALGVRNLAGYNERVKEAEAMGRPIPDPFWKPSDSMGNEPRMLAKEPFIVVLVDEFADLMMTVGKKVEELIARLAQKARAAGIHLVLATQRPSVDVITGLIKANIPTRIAFTVSSKIDSRTILDQSGAESLLGMGDMLYMAPNSSIPIRVHGAFVRDQEVHAVVQDWKARGRPQYVDNILSGGEEGEGGALGLEEGEELDPLFDQAVAFVVEKRRASISGVQRQFRIGYNRAARIVEQMEAQSIVSAPGHNGNREVLAPPPHEV